ncbi:MAG: ABC transporter ATP-binding protein [Candidatus Nomurabacteria bacterium]|jgi:putative ABC transport system ATP-binding protein|nr:ABC transporter ATP-binding protein [Candidatus Nomurabacteria bacterium]
MLESRPIISIKNLTKTYGKKSNAFTALKNVSLDIKAGESVAIIGKSGSGKSTLMHILALLDKPSSGSVEIDGVKSSKLSNHDLNKLRNHRFGFVFQQFFMNANDTVLNNVILPLKIGGVAIRERKKRAMEALRAVDLADKAKSKAINLSGGQKQRVCIARALVNNPKVIFADEPTGNLDSVTGEIIEKILFNLNQEKGITLIIVTHDADLARKCQRQIHTKDGQIISDTNKGLKS